MQEAQLFLVMLIFLEIFELFWQRGGSIQEYLKNLFYFYKKGVLVFIILHPTFYFSIFAQLALQNFSMIATTITFIKFFDLSFKISLMDKLYKHKDLGVFSEIIKENMQISQAVKLSAPILYSSLFYFGYLY